MMDALKRLEGKVKLSPVHRILLTTDGSVTRILEAIGGEKVWVETKEQQIVGADKEIAKLLEVSKGEEVNYRVVELKNTKGTLVHAVSYTPLKRLKPEFREDIMRRDKPIGKIMAELKMEARREINSIEALEADAEMAEAFSIEPGDLLLKRNSNIIHEGKPLLNITEIFPHEKF